jgi:hypothetical protein
MGEGLKLRFGWYCWTCQLDLDNRYAILRIEHENHGHDTRREAWLSTFMLSGDPR